MLPVSVGMAVLYYVAPESGFTLDLLSWSPGISTLFVRHCLQLHGLADAFSFLVGSIVLDLCTGPNCHSGQHHAVLTIHCFWMQ